MTSPPPAAGDSAESTPPMANGAGTARSTRADELRRLLVRNVDSQPRERELRPPLYDTLCARLATGTAARKLAASVDVVAPGMRSCPYHFHHAQEELFVVLEGRGSLRVAGELLAVGAGDVVFIPPGPDYPHQFINSSDAPLKYLSIGTRDSPEIVEYPDSGKYFASAEATPGHARFARVQRSDADLDYWLGEP